MAQIDLLRLVAVLPMDGFPNTKKKQPLKDVVIVENASVSSLKQTKEPNQRIKSIMLRFLIPFYCSEKKKEDESEEEGR